MSTSGTRTSVDLPAEAAEARCTPSRSREARRTIADAEQPVLYVGGGALIGDAMRRSSARRQGRLPVVTTLMGMGAFPERTRSPSAGPACTARPVANYAVQVRLPDRRRRALRRSRDRQAPPFATGRQDDPPRHRPAAIGKLRAVDVPVVGPLAQGREPWRPWPSFVEFRRPQGLAQPDQRVAEVPVSTTRARGPSRRYVIGDTSRPTAKRCSHRRRPAPDVGRAVHRWRRPRQMITSGGLGTMGFGIPAAIGAKAGPRPEATVGLRGRRRSASR